MTDRMLPCCTPNSWVKLSEIREPRRTLKVRLLRKLDTTDVLASQPGVGRRGCHISRLYRMPFLNDLIPLTPAMFLRGLPSAAFPEGQLLEGYFQKDYQNRQSIQEQLKIRFKREYVAQLVQRGKERSRGHMQPRIGDIVPTTRRESCG